MVTLLAQLDPTVDDLGTWLPRDTQPTFDLLGNARWNSALPAWLAALPSLAWLSR